MRILLFFLLSGMLAACSHEGHDHTGEAATTAVAEDPDLVTLTPAQEQTVKISFVYPTMENLASQLQVNGKVDVPTENLVTVSMPLGGYVRQVSLLPGENVRKGQVLARLEDPQYIEMQQDYLMARAKLDYTRQDYARQKRLAAGDATSTKAVQLASAEYQSQQVQVSALAEKVRMLGLNPTKLSAGNLSRSIPLVAPINGFVSKVNINPGKYVQASDVLIEMIDPSDIHLNLTVFEQDLASLYVGQPVVAYTTARPDKTHHARIVLISRDLSADHSAEVHCHFDSYDPSLAPGTFMTAKIELSGKQSWVLPATALVRDGGKDYIFLRQENHRYRMQEVRTGNAENGKVAVSWDGFDPKNLPQVVVEGSYSLLMQRKAATEEGGDGHGH